MISRQKYSMFQTLTLKPPLLATGFCRAPCCEVITGIASHTLPSGFKRTPTRDRTVNRLPVNITGQHFITSTIRPIFEHQSKSVWLPSLVGANTQIRRVSQHATALQAPSQLTNYHILSRSRLHQFCCMLPPDLQ